MKYIVKKDFQIGQPACITFTKGEIYSWNYFDVDDWLKQMLKDDFDNYFQSLSSLRKEKLNKINGNIF